MNLTDQFRSTIKKENLGSEDAYLPTYRTGIDVLDYTNGRKDPETGEIIAGIDGGKITTVIGKSGTGKTTLAIQMATNIVEPYENGQIVHYDFERATTKNRIQSLSEWPSKKIKDKYILLKSDIYAERFYKGVKALATLKIKNKDNLELDTGKVDDEGNPIKVLPPTVVILDSLAVMSPENIENEEELSGGMSASAVNMSTLAA